MSEFVDNLTTKLGPFPVWVWGGLAGGAIVGVRAITGRSKSGDVPASTSTTTSGPATTDAPPASVAATSSEAGSFMAAGTYVPPSSASDTYSPGTADPTSSTAYPADNDEWSRQAITLVVSKNTSLTYVEVTEAIRAYLDGRAVTEQQSAIVELALRAAGTPPYPVPPINVVRATPIATTAPQSATPAPAPAPAPWAAPAVWGGSRFVRGDAGRAVYLVIPGAGLQWVPSEDALRRLAGPGDMWSQVLVVPSDTLRGTPRTGATPSPSDDPSLA